MGRGERHPRRVLLVARHKHFHEDDFGTKQLFGGHSREPSKGGALEELFGGEVDTNRVAVEGNVFGAQQFLERNVGSLRSFASCSKAFWVGNAAYRASAK